MDSFVSKTIKITVFFFAFMFIAFLSAGCSKKKEEEVKLIRPVRYVTVDKYLVDNVRRFSGVAEAGTESNLSFKVPGSIIKIAKTGDCFSKGQLIARLDPEQYQLRLEENKATYEKSKAQLINAKSFYTKTRALYVEGNAAKTDLDSARARYESSYAQLKVDKKQIEIAELNLKYTYLIAPESGCVAQTFVELNENVRAGDKIALLLAGSEKDVVVNLPESFIYKVKKGMKVSVTFDALPDKEFAGVIEEISTASPEDTTTYPVTIKLAQQDDKITSGMSAVVGFDLGSKELKAKTKFFVVPSVAVGQDEKGKHVFKLKELEDGKAQIVRIPVVIGDLVSGGIEIKKGLNSGDKVVTAGVSKIIDGDIVKLETMNNENN